MTPSRSIALVVGLVALVYGLMQVFTWYACVVDDSTFQRVLQEEGYTNIESGAYQWDGCPKGDHFRRGFRAEIHGRTVEGVVCCEGTWRLSCDVRH